MRIHKVPNVKTALSRRDFSLLIGAAAPALLTGQRTGSDACRIKIDTERVVGDIDPKLYGNFLEHLGRCVTGGVFDEGSQLSDAHGFRKDVLKAAQDLHVSFLRWPGGNFSSNYNWRDGIGPRESRPRRLEMAWGTIEDNRFGTHEFLDYVSQLGAEPYICANFGTGTWDQAQQWVEYVNFAGDTTTTRLRKQNGRDAPWNVKYWGLGNEMDGPWQMGHRTAEDYGKFALEGAKLMHWTDPKLQLVAAGSSNYAADWIGWNRTVLSYLKEHIGFLSLHMYVGNKENDYYEFQASTVDLAQRIRVSAGLIEEALLGAPKDRKIYLAWDEYNVWYRARGDAERGRRILEEHYNLEDALVISGFLNTFVNHANVVKIANMAQLVNVIAPIFSNDKGIFLQTIFYPLQLFATHSHGTALDVFVDSPTYNTKTKTNVPYIDVSAVHTQDGNLVLNVTNRHRDRPLDTVVELEDKRFGGEAEVYEVNGPDIKSENNFNSVSVQTKRQKSPAVRGTTLKCTFPAHSFTTIKAPVSSL